MTKENPKEKKQKPKLKRGAPRKHADKISKSYDDIIAMASRGMSQNQIALCLGIPCNTFSKNKKMDKKLKDAIEQGKAQGVKYVTGMLFKNISAGNIPAQIFYLKVQAGWKEKIVVERGDPLAIPDGEQVTAEDAAAIYLSRMQQVRPEE